MTEPGDESAAPSVPDDTNTVGVQWSGDADREVPRRGPQRADGKWKPQGTVDGARRRRRPGQRRGASTRQQRIGAQFASEPVGVDDPATSRSRVTSRRATSATSASSRSARRAGFADTSPAPGPLEVNPLAAGGLAFAAAGMRSRPGRAASAASCSSSSSAWPRAAAADRRARRERGRARRRAVPAEPRLRRAARSGARTRTCALQACPEGPDYADPKLVVIHHTAIVELVLARADRGDGPRHLRLLHPGSRLLRPRLQLPRRPVRDHLRGPVRRRRPRASSARTRRTSTPAPSASR